MKRQLYCAIIGDINKSRDLPDRAKVQRKFHKAIETINSEYKRDIASKFVLTLGDEFQGLLISATDSYRLVRRFQDIMGEVPFAFGIGIGGLSTPLNRKAAVGMDGECFHRARAAINRAKKSKREVVFDFESPALSPINALVGLMEKQWSLLTPRQKEITQLMKSHDNNQRAVAKELKVSPQAVWKAYSSTTINQMNEAEHALRGFLTSLL